MPVVLLHSYYCTHQKKFFAFEHPIDTRVTTYVQVGIFYGKVENINTGVSYGLGKKNQPNRKH